MASSRKKRPARPAVAPKRQRYGEQALERLAWLMQHAESEQAQVAAAKELLERSDGPGGRGAADGKGLGEVVAKLRALRGDG